MPERVHQHHQRLEGDYPSPIQAGAISAMNISKAGPGQPLSAPKARAKSLLSFRKTLPITSHAAEIRQTLREKSVMLLIGETGSGKSTQVPQYLVSEPWCESKAVSNCTVGGCIAITEPRRVAAINLARRVSDEMGTTLGSSSPASKVGYSVRFDNSTSANTQIKYLTEGMLLQELLRDPWLRAYSGVIVDEVHERGVNVDLILGFLRQITAGKSEGRGGIPLKVVVMSATAEMERLEGFFNEAFKEMQDTNPKDEESEWSGLSSSEDERGIIPYVPSTVKGDFPKNNENNGFYPEWKESVSPPHPQVAICHYKGRQYPVTIIYTHEPVSDIVDAALRTVFQINYKEPMPGDILVFLTGQETIESLEKLIKQHAQSLGPDVPKLLALPLFAALPPAAQQQVFEPAPAKTRKVIIATNIAETSLTVSGVRYVVDCGKAKVKHYRSKLGLDSLLSKPISKSAAIQRKGRAGREAPGQCYRLYTEADYLTMQESNTPEILRCDLALPILMMKARGVDDIINFPFLDQPPHQAFLKACQQLYQLGALNDSGAISAIGQRMAKLPLTAPLARTLIAATDPDLNCAPEVIDIISSLSVENIFLNLVSDDKKEAAEPARRELHRREGDHLTLLTTVRAYAAEHSDRKAWCNRHFVSHRAMKAVMEVRKQLRQQCKTLLGQKTQDPSPSELTAELAVSILKCFLKGFMTSTARLYPDGSYKTIVGNDIVAIHPSSVLFGKKVEAIVYDEYVFTNRNYARGVSAVTMQLIGEAFGV